MAAELERVRRAAREAAQDKAEAVRRKQMRHVLFTTPEVVEVRCASRHCFGWDGKGCMVAVLMGAGLQRRWWEVHVD